MDIAGIVGQEQTSAASQSGATLTNDFDDFLHLLTVQLQYQDPLAPMDTNQFTEQLVSFTGVEQAIQTNKNLENIVAQNKSLKNTNAVGYLGKEITIGTNQAGLTEEGTATWEYLLDATANSVKITIKDNNGLEVDTAIGELSTGIHTLSGNVRIPFEESSMLPFMFSRLLTIPTEYMLCAIFFFSADKASISNV